MTHPAAILCLLVLSVFPHARAITDGDAVATCSAVVASADEDALVPPALAVSTAWAESGFNAAAVSTAGARGPLQTLPAFWCPRYIACVNAGARGCRQLRNACDYTAAGVRALHAFILAAWTRSRPRSAPYSPWVSRTLQAWPRRVVRRAVCRFTGCAVASTARTHKAKERYVDAIIDRAEWLEASAACRCSAPWRFGSWR